MPVEPDWELYFHNSSQNHGMLHPIAYASCSLDSSKRNYGITELEMLAVVWAAGTSDHISLVIAPLFTLTIQPVYEF